MSAMLALETYRQAQHLRAIASEDILANDANRAYAYFNRLSSDTAIPVLIAARNEANDLPATLLSISKTADALPYVIDNGSSDETAEIAGRMGAVVLEEPQSGKTKAIKTGLEHILANTSQRTVLLTDADVIVNSRWAPHMRSVCETTDGSPVVATGLAAVAFGHNRRTDLLRTIVGNLTQYGYRSAGKAPKARGSNMAIRFNEAVLDSIRGLPDAIFPGSDDALQDAALRGGSTSVFTGALESLVIMRGDRFSSITQFILNRAGVVPSSSLYTELKLDDMQSYEDYQAGL